MELKAAYGGIQYDEGEYDATGTCTGGYLNCNCQPVGQSFLAPTFTFQTYEFPTGDEYEWWWNIKEYGTRSFNPCTSGNCENDGYASETDATFMESDVGWDDEIFTPCAP